MPTTRKRTRRSRREIEDWQIEFLLHGRVLRPDGRPSLRPFLYERRYDGCFARTAARALWAERRGEILTDWIKTRPGTRPWAWWCFDAPEDRPEGESELNYLRRLDLLTPGEMEG